MGFRITLITAALLASPVPHAALGSYPDSSLARVLWENRLNREQQRTDRMKESLCREEATEDCRVLADIDLTLKGVRGDLADENTWAQTESIRKIGRDLNQVTQDLTALERKPSETP